MRKFSFMEFRSRAARKCRNPYAFMTNGVGRVLGSVLLLLGMTVPVSAKVFTVGEDRACTHRDLKLALADAQANGPEMDEIRVSMNGHYNAGRYFIIDQSVRIVGGYQFCSSQSKIGLTTMGGSPRGHFSIASAPERRSVVELSDLKLREGNGPIAGGSLAIYGRADVTVINTIIQNNWAESGGAVYIDGLKFADPARVTFVASQLSGNSSIYAGGAIDCHGNAQVVLKEKSVVESNTSRVGGGVALDDCHWWQGGGTRVYRNKASHLGGGIYAAAGSYLYATWAATAPAPPMVIDNESERIGAGIALIGQSTYLDARGLELAGNYVHTPFDSEGAELASQGAALYANDGATAWLHRDDLCLTGHPDCSRIFVNIAEAEQYGGSIIYSGDRSLVTISQTEISNNASYVQDKQGGALLRVADYGGNQGHISLRNDLVARNYASALLRIASDNPNPFKVALSTFKDNRVKAIFDGAYGEPAVSIDMAASVIDESTPLTRNPLASGITLDCVLSRVDLGVPSTRSVVLDPALAADGVPLSGSPAIDYCGPEGLPLFEADLLGRSRPYGVFEELDFYGPVDVGAYEVVPPPIGIGPPH
jgi:hypothetical protein